MIFKATKDRIAALEGRTPGVVVITGHRRSKSGTPLIIMRADAVIFHDDVHTIENIAGPDRSQLYHINEFKELSVNLISGSIGRFMMRALPHIWDVLSHQQRLQILAKIA
jgi:hypothetical protein